MAFNKPTTTPTRVRPSNAPNGTHHFPPNPSPPTTQTTLENSAICFHYDPQHQPLWKDSLLGKKKLLRYKCLCACVTCSKKKLARKEKDEGKRTNALCFFEMFLQFTARAHDANLPGTLPPITVSFKNIKIMDTT